MKQKEVTNNVNWNANATEYIVNVHTFWATRLKRTLTIDMLLRWSKGISSA